MSSHEVKKNQDKRNILKALENLIDFIKETNKYPRMTIEGDTSGEWVNIKLYFDEK